MHTITDSCPFQIPDAGDPCADGLLLWKADVAYLPLEIQTDNGHLVGHHCILLPVYDWESPVPGLVQVDTRGRCTGSDRDVDVWGGVLQME